MPATKAAKRPAPKKGPTSKAAPAASHDADVTPELRSFMKKSWAPAADVSSPVAEVAKYAAARRARLSAAFPGEVLVVPAGRLKARSNDSNYSFRAHTAYAWLTGHQGEGGVLVMTPKGKAGHTTTLYIRPRSDRSTEAFYRDRNYGELWVGPRPGIKETASMLDIASKPLADLEKFVAKWVDKPLRRMRVDGFVERALGVGRPDADTELAQWLSEARLIKDDWEIAELQLAVDATKRGFEDVIAEMPGAKSERWLEGTFYRRARNDGNDVGYGSIVACGHNACVLHWTENDGAVKAGDLALLDMGVEGYNLYTADVTRTVPVSGKFTPTQRKVYNAVLAAQEAGIAATRAGASFLAPHDAAMRVLCEKLVGWGLLTGSIDKLMKTETYRRYTLHGTSHMLGMDVHDCAQARNEFYRGGTLQAGMVITVEPGLYFQRDDLTVPKAFRGIGVRIEDDVVVTDGMPQVLSAAIPKKAVEVERWISSVRN
jgi:Xaa-Pro aminopeptidase